MSVQKPGLLDLTQYFINLQQDPLLFNITWAFSEYIPSDTSSDDAAGDVSTERVRRRLAGGFNASDVVEDTFDDRLNMTDTIDQRPIQQGTPTKILGVSQKIISPYKAVLMQMPSTRLQSGTYNMSMIIETNQPSMRVIPVEMTLTATATSLSTPMIYSNPIVGETWYFYILPNDMDNFAVTEDSGVTWSVTLESTSSDATAVCISTWEDTYKQPQDCALGDVGGCTQANNVHRISCVMPSLAVFKAGSNDDGGEIYTVGLWELTVSIDDVLFYSSCMDTDCVYDEGKPMVTAQCPNGYLEDRNGHCLQCDADGVGSCNAGATCFGLVGVTPNLYV